MDRPVKKTGKKKIGKKVLITIVILLVILLFIVGGGCWYYTRTMKLIREKQDAAAEMEPDTSKIERGDLTNTLDDISGIVRSNQSVYLYWQTSGTVSAVNVEVGDPVKKGDVLAELDISTIDSSIIDAEVEKESAEEKLERLYTSTLALEQARTKMVQAKKSVEDARKEFDSLGIIREDDLALGVKYQDYMTAVRNYENAQKDFEDVKERALDDTVRIRAQQRLESARTRMDSAKSEYNWYNGEAEEIDVQKADAALKLAQAQLDDAERAYNRIKDGPTENQVRSLQAQIDSARATVNTSKIVAPIDGTVAQVDVKPYDVIAYESTSTARDILAIRIDDLSSHYIDISVTELDVNKISLGQEVTITFDAIPLREYTGKIVNISNAGTVSNLSVNYALTVKMDEADGSIKSGMMADVAIVTDHVKNALYVPQKAVSVSDDGITRVVKKVNSDGSVTEIPVQVGLNSGTDVQIISDQLAEGDEVQLTKVTSMMNSDFSFGSMFGMMGGGAPGGGRPPAGGGGRPPGGGSGRPPGGGGRP